MRPDDLIWWLILLMLLMLLLYLFFGLRLWDLRGWNRRLPRGAVQVASANIEAACGEVGLIHSVLNITDTDQVFLVIVKNTGDRCRIDIRIGGPIDPATGNPTPGGVPPAIIATALPNASGSGMFPVKANSSIVVNVYWDCHRISDVDLQPPCVGGVRLVQLY
jgi:hypothetical protein